MDEMYELAERLYELTSDMDHSDYAESRDEDIKRLATELEALPKDSSLLACLQML